MIAATTLLDLMSEVVLQSDLCQLNPLQREDPVTSGKQASLGVWIGNHLERGYWSSPVQDLVRLIVLDRNELAVLVARGVVILRHHHNGVQPGVRLGQEVEVCFGPYARLVIQLGGQELLLGLQELAVASKSLLVH